MENSDLKSMAIDDLWELHEQVVAKLTRELSIEKARLEERLHKLGSASKLITSDRQRRPYPKVLPKYRNPKNPAETWSGREWHSGMQMLKWSRLRAIGKNPAARLTVLICRWSDT